MRPRADHVCPNGQKIEQDMEAPGPHDYSQQEIKSTLGSMAASTIERVQRIMETSRIGRLLYRSCLGCGTIFAQFRVSKGNPAIIDKLSDTLFQIEITTIYSGLREPNRKRAANRKVGQSS